MRKVTGYIYGANETNKESYGFEYTKQVNIEGVEIKEDNYAVYRLEKDWFEDKFMFDGMHDMVVFCDEIRASYTTHEETIVVPADAEYVIFQKEDGEECDIYIKETFENTLDSYFKEANECRLHSFTCKESYMTEGKMIGYKDDTVVATNEGLMSFLEISNIHVLVDGEMKRIYSGLLLNETE